MELSRLIKKLTAYGADMRGIKDRFMGDAELYEKCYLDFLDERNFDLLSQAVETNNHKAAFEAAHALKGLSGNLGLTPFYETVNALAESLRAGQYDNIRAEYQAVEAAKGRLKALLTDEAALPDASAKKEAGNKTSQRLMNRFTRMIGLTLVGIVLGVSLLFTNLIKNYGNQIDVESANHLEEINYQIKLYIEEKIESDWQITHSVANSIVQTTNEDIYHNLLAYIAREKEIWGVSEIIVYAENGVGMRSDGTIISNSLASDTAYYARQLGEYLTIVQSELTYTVPVDTDMQMDGSKIVAVSVMQDVGSFLDNMDFSSFGGTAYMYLTQENGIVISRLTHADISPTYNIMSFLDGKELRCLEEDGHAMEHMLTSDRPVTHLMIEPADERYVVSTPIDTHQANMRLFYVVPEAVVNLSMNDFSAHITRLSVLFIVIFAVFSLIIFLFILRSRKKQFDEALIERERMYDMLVQNSGTAFAMFSTESDRPLYISVNAQRIIGDRYLSLEKTPTGYRMKNDSGTETEAVRRINAEMADWDGRDVFRSGYIRRPAGENEGYYSFQLYPIDDSGREYVGIAQDATRAHDREKAVTEALAMAERSNEAKSNFLSNMSHDIRTPMNAIINMTDFALENIGNPNLQRKYLQIIRESSDHLLRLINDVLDMSRIESGQAVVGAEPFDIKAELNNICDIIRPLCVAKSQTFIVDTEGVRTTDVLGDQVKVSQILVNLLGNAVKFTPDRGAIRFTAVEMPSIRPDFASMRFIVEDNGIGISEENRKRIFEPFMRVDDKRVSGIEGTGLGLPICKSYVSAMDGTITCKSEEENGSTFTVELTFRRAQEKTVAEAPPKPSMQGEQPFIGKRCLLCEDNPTNLMIAATILKKIGFMVDTASDGREGVARFIASGPNEYDIVYMDIRMPMMDGYQATVAIRESIHPRARTVPIIAMTANVLAEDIEKSRIAGMNGHLGKPIVVMELIDETRKALENGGY